MSLSGLCARFDVRDAVPANDGTRRRSVRRSIASSSFAQRYFTGLNDDDDEHVSHVWVLGRDLADSIVTSVLVRIGTDQQTTFRAEHFFDGYAAFCLLTPAK